MECQINPNLQSPTVTIVTLFDRHMSEVGKLCTRSIEHFFAAKTSCRIQIFDELIDSALAPSWNKILATKLLLPSTDWLFWIDADCVVHREISFSEFTNSKAHFRPSQDYNGFNCGVFLIKNSTWSMQFLESLLFLGDVNDFQAFGMNDGPKWEQNTVKSLFNSFGKIAEFIDPLPRSFVSDPTIGFTPDSAIFHAFQMKNKDRIIILNDILRDALSKSH